MSSRSEKVPLHKTLSLSTSQNALGKSLLGVSITSCRHSGGIVGVRNMICLQRLEELASISHNQDFLTPQHQWPTNCSEAAKEKEILTTRLRTL